MASIQEIENQLKSNRNWILVSGKERALQCLQICLGNDESIADLIEGLYTGMQLTQKDPGHAGILCVTNKRVLFIGTEEDLLFEEILYADINSTANERVYSSWKLIINTGKGVAAFTSFSTHASMENFRDLIIGRSNIGKDKKSEISEPNRKVKSKKKPEKLLKKKASKVKGTAKEKIKSKLQEKHTKVKNGKKNRKEKEPEKLTVKPRIEKKKDDIRSEQNDTKILINNEMSGHVSECEATEETITGPINMNFLFLEAKKIGRTISKYIQETGSSELKELIVNDLLLLSSLCSQVDKKTTDEEKIFISMVFLPLNISDTRTMEIESAAFYSKNLYPFDFSENLILYFDKISEFITRSNVPVKKAAFLSLPYLKYYDERHGTNHYNVMVSILNTYANCLLKADGQVNSKERNLLKKLVEIIQRSSQAGTYKKNKFSFDTPEDRKRKGKKKNESAAKKVEVEENKSEEKDELPDKYIDDDFNKSETLEDVMGEINALVGMENIKKEIKTFINVIKVYKERDRFNMQTPPLSLHAVFYGPPGTGKTTIARLLGRVYRCLGLLEKGHLIETDRVGLIAGYIGQTAIKVEEVIQKALDGILFIDEAYSLIPDGELSGKDFGQEAISLILKRMEDYRDRLVIIVAGYPDEMKRLINSNPGLQSRFSRYFYFDHYDPDVLLKIYDRFCSDVDFATEEPARKRLLSLLKQLCKKRTRTFGNGRVVRNIFERAVEKQANRIADIVPLTENLLRTITEDDIPDKDEITVSI